MKKCAVLIGLLFILGGWTFPQDSPYLVINSSRGNNEYVYFASNMVEYLHVTSTSVISSYSGNLYGYTGNDTRYTWTIFSNPTYSSGYQQYDLNITQVVENHLYPDERSIISKNYELYTLAIIGGVLIVCMLKK